MGTNNFALKYQANKYYIIEEPDFEYDGDAELWYEYDFKNILNNIVDKIEQKKQELNLVVIDNEVDEISNYDNDRNYPTKRFAYLETNNVGFIGNETFYIKFYLLYTSGYYSGATLDYDFKIEDFDGEKYDSVDDLISNIREYPEDYNICIIEREECDENEYDTIFDEKEFEQELTKLKTDLNNAISKISKEIENVYAEATTPAVKAGQFSNGEAIYIPVQKENLERIIKKVLKEYLIRKKY